MKKLSSITVWFFLFAIALPLTQARAGNPFSTSSTTGNISQNTTMLDAHIKFVGASQLSAISFSYQASEVVQMLSGQKQLNLRQMVSVKGAADGDTEVQCHIGESKCTDFENSFNIDDINELEQQTLRLEVNYL